MVRIYNRVLLSRERKIGAFTVTWMNLDSSIQSEVTQKETSKYTNMYTQDAEKCY